jgi:hypothetical protein
VLVHQLHRAQQSVLERPLPTSRIEIIIDQAAGYEMLSLLDCFSVYHQVWMRREDEEKMGFTTSFEVFCFVRMPEVFVMLGPLSTL